MRQLLFFALAGLGLATWETGECQAQPRPLANEKLALLQPDPEALGLLVTRVLPETTAAQQGLKAGDRIVSVNGHTVRSVADLNFWIGDRDRRTELGVIAGTTGKLNRVAVFPHNGQIGVVSRPTHPEDLRPSQPSTPPVDRVAGTMPQLYPPQFYPPPVWPIYPPPVWPIYPPDWHVRPFPPIWPPSDWGVRPIPPIWPPPSWPGQPIPLPLPGGFPRR